MNTNRAKMIQWSNWVTYLLNVDAAKYLESAEPEGAFHGVLYSYAGYGQAFANGYGECIHSYGNRNKQDLNDYRNHGVTEGSSPDYRAMGLDQRSYTPPTPS